MKLTRAEQLLALTTGVGVLHHLDHVLRVDHSGWPAIPLVTPFTYSLLVYPLIASVFWLRNKPWYRFWAILVIFIMIQASHTFIEPPHDIYHTWAYGSELHRAIGPDNTLLGIHSPLLGVIGVIIQIGLSLLLIATSIAFYQEARKAKAGDTPE